MYVPFNELPAHSRIWIYQANRAFTPDEKKAAEVYLKEFCEGWVAHQQALKTSFSIEHDQFVILATDEDYHQPSGCSIDSSVKALKHLQAEMGFDLFDRTKVAFIVDGKVATHPLSKLKSLFENGELKADMLTFDNLVPSRGDLLQRWRTPIDKTWLVKYLPNSTLA